MMLTVIARAIAVGALTLCAALPSLADASRVALGGASLRLAPQDAWKQVDDGNGHARFLRSAATGSVALTVESRRLPDALTEQAFLRDAEARQQQVLSAWTKLSAHYHYLQSNGAACMRYDGVFETPSPGAERFIALRGQTCRDPADPAREVAFEVSQRTESRPAAFAVDLGTLTERLAQGLVFTPAAQR